MKFSVATAIFAFALAWIGAVFGASEIAPTRGELSAEAAITENIKAARAMRAPNAPHLEADPVLTEIARARSRAMADGAPFSHQDSQGRYPAFDMVIARFGPYGTIGENIFAAGGTGRAFDPAAYGKRAAEEWMASEEHRENILSPEFNATGVGVVVKGDAAYATQVFRGPPPQR